MPPRRRIRLPRFLRRDARDLDAQVEEELASHLAMREEHLRTIGWDDERARAEALRRLGGLDAARTTLRAAAREREELMQRRETLDTVRQDVAYAIRQARRSPGFFATALLTLVLGIGATTAVFAVVDAVVVRALPYPEPDRLVRILHAYEGGGRGHVSTPNVDDLRAQATRFAAIGGAVWNEATVLGGREPVRARVAATYGDFFGAIGVAPHVGRTLRADETPRGAATTAVVSYRFWRDQLGARPLDGNMLLGMRGGLYQVVGVMPEGFAYPSHADIWIGSFFTGDTETARNSGVWGLVGRMKPGVSVTEARAETGAIMARLKAAHPELRYVTGFDVQSLQDAVVGGSRRLLLLLFGAIVFVLLIACVNLASASLARGEARQREMAIRATLGAGRGRLSRQLLTESLLLGLAGGVGGAALAVVLTRVLVAMAPSNIPRLSEVGVDWRVLLFAVVTALVSGALVGLLPALQVRHVALQHVLARGGRGATGGSRARRVLVATEIALALVLLVCAGLLTRSFRTLMDADLGFESRDVVTADLALPEGSYTEDARIVRFLDRLLEGIDGAPGIDAAGVINSLPLSQRDVNGGIVVEGREGEDPRGAFYRLVGGDVFGALGMRVVRGRALQLTDGPTSAHVAVVSERFARMVWPDADPVGRRIRWNGDMDGRGDEWLTVVGVVNEVRARSFEGDEQPAVYVSYRQRPGRALEGMSVVVRAPNAADAAALVRARSREVDPDVPIELTTMDAVVERAVADRRFAMRLLSGFGAFALFLAALGVYGVLAYTVTRRTREIGVRMALGARRGSVVGQVVRDAARSVVPGVAIGALGAWGATKLVHGLLYGVEPGDPLVFVSSVLVLVAATAVACWVPAWRATRVDPVVALRAE